MKIKLADGTELNAVGVHGRSVFYQGIQRDSLIFIFDTSEHSIGSIAAAFSESNCTAITLESDDGSTATHAGYTIRISIAQGHPDELIPSGGDVSAAPEYITIKMAQVTYLENLLISQQSSIDALLVSALEG